MKDKIDISGADGRRKLKEFLDKKDTRLTIARIPRELKIDFIKEAKNYSDDFGILFHRLWDNSHEYDRLKEVLLSSGLKIKLEDDKITITK